MREVIPKRVWIGNARDATHVSGVLEKEIAAVVQLAIEEPPVLYPRELISLRFPLLDGEGNTPELLQTAIVSVATLIQANMTVLIACSGGMSRSPAVTATALALMQHESPEEWLQKIAICGPLDVAPALWNDVRKGLLLMEGMRRFEVDR